MISYGRALQYATPAEAGGYSKPIRLAIVPHDDSTAVGNTVVWSGLSLLVQKTDVLTCRGETVARVLILA